MSAAKQPPAKRGVAVVGIVGVMAILCMLLGRDAIEGYIEKQQTSTPPDGSPPPSPGSGGRVTFADGSPASGARVTISWRDSAGRPGTTPAVAGADGSFALRAVPDHATITEVRASKGPLAATAGSEDLAGAREGRANVVLAREFRLGGLIRRAGDRNPISGAEIELGGARVKTGPDGDFKLEKVPWTALIQSRPVAHLSAEGYAPLAWPISEDDPPESYGDVTILMEPLR